MPAQATAVVGDLQGAVAQDDETSLAQASARRELDQLEGELAALRATQTSVSSTSQWLAQRIDQDSAQAAALSMGQTVARLTGMSARLADVEERLGSLRPVIERAAQRCGALTSELQGAPIGARDGDADQLAELRSEALAQRDELRRTSQAADGLVRDVSRINIDLEGVRNALEAQRGEVAEPGSEVLTVPAWVAAEPVVEMSTSQGTLVLALRPDVAPRHVENFRRLVADGFYDGLSFHRIVPGFLIQGGDPQGTGMGGPGWQIPAEFNDLPHLAGTLSMARMGQWDTAGSQFFICLGDWSSQLDHKYTVFGKVLRGQGTLDNIAALGSSSGVPSEPVIIIKAVSRERRPTDVPDER